MGAMTGPLSPAATRTLSDGEKMLVLKNHVVFLEEQLSELEGRIGALVDDNAEMDFLASINERARTDEVEEMYRANVARIEELRREVAAATADVDLYRRLLAERYGAASVE